jgi:hypothetical protein
VGEAKRLDSIGNRIIIPVMQTRNILRAIAAEAVALPSFPHALNCPESPAPGRIGGRCKPDARWLSGACAKQQRR